MTTWALMKTWALMRNPSMPVTTPKQKIMKTEMFGAGSVEVRLTGDYFDDTLATAQAWCAAEGGHFLSPFDDDDVIERTGEEVLALSGGGDWHMAYLLLYKAELAP